MKWTLVQHSGVDHDRGFSRAVEEAAVPDGKTERRIRDLGGVLFDSYEDASAAEYRENYPDEVQGIYPRVRGSFATFEVGRQKLYLPVKQASTLDVLRTSSNARRRATSGQRRRRA